MDQLLNVSIVWHHFYGVTFVTGETNFEVKAKAVSAENKIGKLDFLPGHANLMSVVHKSIIVYTADGQTNVYFFERGIVEVSGNNVQLFLEGKKT